MSNTQKSPFWMVWCEHRGFPSVRHVEQSTAIEEAKRIAAKERSPVLVLECIGAVVPLEPPVEWRPHNPAVVPPDPPHNAEVVPEWPKWINYCGCVRVFVDHNKAYALDWLGKWNSSVVVNYIGYECHQITRAEAVRLIGEAAVVEGERMAGVPQTGAKGGAA